MTTTVSHAHDIAPAYIRMRQALILSSLSRAQINRMVADGRLPKPGKLSTGVAVWPYHEFLAALRGLYAPPPATM